MGSDLTVVNAAKTTSRKAIEEAYDRGYRVSEEGVLTSPTGKILKVSNRGKQRYPTFSLNGHNLTKSKVWGIPVHHFAAYCFYKEKLFDPKLVVRHLDSNTLNIAKNNIVLGTPKENTQDKSPEVRHKAAKIARASQPYEAINRKLSIEQVREIRELYKNRISKIPQGLMKAIKAKYGVSSVTIHNVINNKTYKDVI